MKNTLKIFCLIGALFAGNALADMGLPNLDRTDKIHSRRYLDSINVYNRRPIRLNQSGFRPQDYKYAYVADTKEKNFRVIDANSGAEAWSGSLSPIQRRVPIYNADSSQILGYESKPVTKPAIYVNGAFSSITSVYEFGKVDDTTKDTELLYRADFTGLAPTTPGEYFVVVGKDTSATFHIHPSIFNSILENSLKFFGVQRCGDTKSNFHGACHLKDGSAIGHNLTGGWHDCGDHFKVSETLGYTAYVLSMVYLTYQDKAEDRYGESYADTVFTDGIPDILHEAKVGTDYILKLYNASKADGLIEKGEMYHSVGVADADHAYWDKPERQDAQAPAQGGPDRDVTDGIGTGVAGIFAAAMANVAVGYRVYDPAYSDSLLAAAKDIYKNVMIPAFKEKRNTTGHYYNQFYTGQGPMNDDCAAAAFALWYATKDTTYQYDLYKNPTIYNNATNYQYNLDYFKAGFLGNQSGFTPGGWASDYQNVHSYVLFAMQKLMFSSEAVSAEYGLSPAERDTLSMRTMATFRKLIDNATNDGDSLVLENPATQGDPHEGSSKLHVITPYNLVWTSFDWGVMRYNMGTAVSIFLMYELTGDERYLKVALDNMYFILGANPWDISFLMGAGDKNPQHPHNRASNPDGYNAGGLPYEYRCPIGALMGAREPNKTLIEDWSKYTSTETCIDFTAQFLFPAQSLAQPLPLDVDGPLFSNIAGTPISDTEAIISWDANEVALVTVFYNTTPSASGAKNVQQAKASKGGSITLEGLTPGETYYFFLEGMDTKRNMTTDDNHGYWYSFTMTSGETKISGVTICQVDNRSAKIYWWSSDRMNGVVKYGTSPSALTEAQVSNGGAVMFHEVELTDLKPSTTYYFSVSSGATTDDNGAKGYSFTTKEFATYANLTISMKPSNKNSNCADWKNCNTFFLIITNNDTTVYEDLEIRLYLDKSVSANSYDKSLWSGTGQPDYTNPFDIIVGNYTTDLSGNGYLPITIKGTLYVSGSVFFELSLANNATFNGLENSWSLRAHTAADDPKNFNGIDLTRGPLYTSTSYTTSFIEEVNGKKEIAFRADPYITAYYHGVYIYGYGPDYTPGNGPQVKQTFAMNFTSPFITPYTSVEKQEPATTYEFTTKVSPEGMIDAVELNGPNKEIITLASGDFSYRPVNRTDSIYYKRDTVLQYGNNYIEWVAWHNRNANKQNSYDCACTVVRTNVEIDTITTPLEQRYLVFNKPSYTAYVGKLVEVNVELVDSNRVLLDTVSLTLAINVDGGNVMFWTQPDSKIPVTSINLVNGRAKFYVSSETQLKADMLAITSGTSQYAYNAARAELIVEKLPPWPIIDFAKMLDTDCDSKPDAMQIALSNEYQQGQSFKSISFTYEGVSYTSTKVIRQTEKELLIAIDIPNVEVNTNPTGSVTLISNLNGTIKENEPDFYQDGISPTLLSVSVLERDTAKTDRVYMQFSEAISSPGTDWPVQLYATDGSSTVDAPNVLFSKLYNDSLNIWEFEIALDASGKSVVTEHMFAQLLSNSAIHDKNGNGVASECGQPKLPILLKRVPVPINYATLSDEDEDGLVEHLYISFTRSVDEKHIPDSVSVIFGLARPETLWVAGSSIVLNATRDEGTIDFAKPFSLGVTSGTFSGASRGFAVEGAGNVIQHLGTGATYESNSALAEDLAGPVITSATILLSKTGETEVLTLITSEPIDAVGSGLPFYAQKQSNQEHNITSSDLITISYGTGTQITSAYNTDSDLAPNDGDFVRFIPKNLGAFADKHGNTPAYNAPWIPISNNGKPKIKFKITMRDEIVQSDKQNISKVTSNRGVRFYIQNPRNNSLDMIENGKIVTTGIDTSMIQGSIWKVDLTVPRGAAGNEPAAWDSMKVKLNLPIYSNMGNYVNRLSEKFNVSSAQYLSDAGKVIFYVEWANKLGTGLQSENGRSAGTGAYIYKAQLTAVFMPNMDKEPDVIKKFSSKNVLDKTATFGIKRVK